MKLLKYEIRKGITLKAILLALYVLVEGAFAYSCFAVKENITVLTAVILFIGGMSSFVIIGVQSMMTLHRDMNTKQAYMLFMTPKSCYSILGAKMVEFLISILVTTGLAVGTLVLDTQLILKHFSQIQELQDIAKQMMQYLKLSMDPASIASFAAELLLGWIFMITTAYFADVLISSLLRGKKFGGFLAFVLFVVLNTLLNQGINAVSIGNTVVIQTVVRSCLTLAASAVMYFVTAHVMETKLSV